MMGQGLPPPWLQTPPLGWLGLLGIKSGGRQPGHSLPDMMPVIDMERFYRAGSRSLIATLTFANTNNADATIGTVPQGKVWLVDRVVCGSTGTLGVAASVLAAIVLYNTNVRMFCGPQTPQRALTGELAICSLDGPFILGPGESVALYSTAAAAPTAFSWRGNVFGSEVSA